MKYHRSKREIVVSCAYWTARHEAAKGGTLSQIAFTFGRGRNILVSPVTSYLRRKEGVDYIGYEEALCPNPTVSVTERGGRITIQACGTYRSNKNAELPVSFRRTWSYEAFGLIRTHLEMIFHQPVDQIFEIGIAGMRLAKSLGTVGFRGAQMDPDSNAGAGSVWRDYSASGTSYADHYFNMGRCPPLYFCAVERGVEGIEWFSGDDPDACSCAFFAKHGQGYAGVVEDPDTNSRLVRIEPYAHWRHPVDVPARTFRFAYCLGLPFSKGKHHVSPPFFHTAISNRWPDEAALDVMADAGVKMIRLHNDYRADGCFWHDGCYPPYDPENMKAMDWVIAQVHRRGMEIVPYFSLKELHPDAPEFARFAAAWKRTSNANQTLMHNVRGAGEFGAQMCLRSGWLEFRKQSIDLVLSRHAFDGVYYDWAMARPCLHPAHMRGRPHTDMDEFLAFMQWTRQRVGPAKRIFVHLSGVPMMVVENLADLVITHEDMQAIVPEPGEFHPETDYAGICAHHVCRPAAAHTPAKARRFVLSAFLDGLWTYPAANRRGDFVLGVMKKLSRFDLTSYAFTPAHDHPVGIDVPSVMGSLYWKKDSALVYLGNLSGKTARVHVHVDLTAKGWPARTRVKLQTPPEGRRSSVGQLLARGFRLHLPALSGCLAEIHRVGDAYRSSTHHGRPKLARRSGRGS